MINCIVAIEKNQGIGFNGQMPWPRLAGDMRWFKDKTTDQIVIMGRKTWESIGSKSLPNRINIVISNNRIDGCNISTNKPEWLIEYCSKMYPSKEIFVIGGSAIYQHFLKDITRFYVTEINHNYQCDTFFNFDYVQKNFTNVKEHATFNEPIPYIIKEYNI